MNELIERLERDDAYLIPYLLDWSGLGPPQPWGAATSFALEVAHGYGLIKGKSDATLTPLGTQTIAALKARQDVREEGEGVRDG